MSSKIFRLNLKQLTACFKFMSNVQKLSLSSAVCINKRLETSKKLSSCVSDSYPFKTSSRLISSPVIYRHIAQFKSSSHHHKLLILIKQYNLSSACEMSDKDVGNTLQVASAPVCETKVVTKETNEDDSMTQSNNQAQNLSKRALKRQARAQKFRELKKKKKAENLAQGGQDAAGYSADAFDETSYYFENGLRKVYPYHFVFSTHAKGRWVGRTLGEVLENEFGFSHPNAVERAFEEEKIYVNNHLVTSDYIVKDCDFISHQTHRSQPFPGLYVSWIGSLASIHHYVLKRHENPVSDSPLEIIENNSDVIVVNKPSSIPCHPCGRYRYNSLVFILGKEMGCSNLRNIYRLDRLTSGVLILGKTAKSTKVLEDQVLNREVQKEYVCRVTGEFPSDTITVDQPLKALSNKLRLQVISPNGKPSQTTFQRLSYNGHSSVVRCIPHTGRTHQIRVHLQYLGHPILNDTFYNSAAWGPCKGKGGVYEVSHEITCAQIYQSHQASLWEGEDNPLYYEKLRKQANELETRNNSKEDDLLTHSEEITPNTAITSTVTEKPACDQNTVIQIRSDQKDQPNDRFPLVSTASDSKEEVSSCSRPTFEASKWRIDMSCDMCRKTSVEPRKKDLVMFLHALKYKGPGWEYATKLPDWAKEDWNREDEFSD